MKISYRSTMLACYCGSIVQAIAINLSPLLYLSFVDTLELNFFHISCLIVGNFSMQLLTDLVCSHFADRIPMRAAVLVAHVAVLIGLVGTSLFPMLLFPFWGLLFSSVLLGLGGGILEIYVSSIIEACPTTQKAGSMSFLHSFYCWGHAGVILLSGFFFRTVTAQEWQLLPLLWCFLPLWGFFAFLSVPLVCSSKNAKEPTTEQKKGDFGRLRCFLCLAVMMFCGGAAEQTVGQWASGFAESVLGLDKAIGDFLCPFLFALMMGVGRLWYSKNSPCVSLEKIMLFGGITCVGGLWLLAVAPSPWLAVVGCAVCGLSVSVFWPGILSVAAEEANGGSVRLFARLALVGDVGCITGPAIAGTVAAARNGNLRISFLFAAIFPCILLLFLGIRRLQKRKQFQKNI